MRWNIHLNGFHHMPTKQDAVAAIAELAWREEELAQLKKHNIEDKD